jgi:site-specific DNA-methyltransferase (cytosine-N4-specific)
LRGTATGGAEVDLIFESARLVFSRWQVQCKNSDRVSLDDVAKEVGLTHMLKSSVIVIVSTGQIGNEARKYANVVSDVKPLHFVFLDRNDLAMIAMHPGALVQRIADQAPIALCRNDEFSFLLERAPHAGIAPISVE